MSLALLTWFLPSSFDMSQILVVPSSEKVANIELSIRAQILYTRGTKKGREYERERERERERESEREPLNNLIEFTISSLTC